MSNNPSSGIQSVKDQSIDEFNFKQLLPILLIVFVDILGLTIIIPVLPFYAIAFNASPLMIGFVVATYPLMQFVFVPVLGALSDRFGRKPILAAAQLGTFSSLLVLGFAHSLWMLFFARAIDGITGANLATVQSAITDSTSSQNRAKGLGLIGATFGVGFVLGPVLSGIALGLSDNNYSAPAFMAAGFAFLSFLLTTFVFKETLPPEKRGNPRPLSRNFGQMITALGDSRLGILFLLALLLQTIFSSFQATFAPFTLNRLGLNSFGNAIFFAAFGVVVATVEGGMIGPLSKRFGERKLIFAGLLFFAAGFLLVSFTPQQPVSWYSEAEMRQELSQQSGGSIETTNEQLSLLPTETNKGNTALWYMLITLLPVPLGFALMSPSISSLITKRAEPQRIGEALGLSAAYTAGGSIIGPLLGGGIFELLSPNAVYILNGLLALLLFWFLWKRLLDVPTEA